MKRNTTTKHIFMSNTIIMKRFKQTIHEIINMSYNSITNYSLVSFGTLCIPTKESTYFLLEISDDLFCSAAIVNA